MTGAACLPGMEAPIIAAGSWADNGAMIADVFRLPYLSGARSVCDMTFGRGTFWSQHSPNGLVAHDLCLDGVDFRALPEADSTFDVVVFDPPYVHGAGKNGSSMAEFNNRFGLDCAPSTWPKLRELIESGFDEAFRVARRGGVVLVKSMPYVASGRLRHTPFILASRAESLGLGRVKDEFVMVRPLGPDTARRANGQLHARRNYSVLQVYEVKA